MSIKGFSINGEVQKYDYNALDNLPNVTGLSEETKTALLACFQNVAWINANGQTYYDALEAALSPATMYSITNNLTGCTTSNSAAVIAEGSAYTATITASSGYTLEGATATATMGGQTVTGFYNNGQISIPNVTGNLVITVTASSSVASISAVFTQGSATIYTTDTLDTLKQYLTVTATYSDSTTATVTDYTLSGTLTEGTSTITVSYGGKTDTFSVTVTSGLDRIAYGELTYRDMFITNNEIIIGDFETTLNLSNTEVDLGDGRTYVINAGTPVQTTELYESPSHSLKCFGTSSTQILYRNASKVFAAGRWLVCISAKVDRYSAGYAGVQSAWPKDQPSKHGGNLGFQRVTNGFEQIAAIYTLDSTDATRTGARFYIGSFLSANLDCYVDDVVCTPIPSGLTESAALLLYKEYLAMRGASA